MHPSGTKAYFLLPLALLMLVSCSKTPDHKATIPEGTEWVAAYDMRSIAEKGKLTDPSEYRSLSLLQGSMEEEGTLQKMFESFMQDPLSLGLDLSKDVYTFSYQRSADDPRLLGFTGAVTERSKFKRTVQDLLSEAGVPGNVEPEQKRGRSYLTVENMVLAWDDGRYLFLRTTSGKEGNGEIEGEAERLLGLKKKKTLVEKNDDFKEFLERKKDLSNWVDMGNYKGSFQRSRKAFGIQGDTDMVNGMKFHTYLDFKANELEVSHYTYNDEWENWDTFKDMFRAGGIEKELLSQLPQEEYMGASASFHPDTLYKLGKDIGGEDLPVMEERASIVQGIDLEKLFASLGGDLLVTVNGFGTYERSYTKLEEKDKSGDNGQHELEKVKKTEKEVFPRFSVVMSTSDSYLTDRLEDTLLSKWDSVAEREGYYEIQRKSYPLYLGWDKGRLIFGSESEAVKKLGQGGFSPSLADTRTGSLFAGSSYSASMVLDMNEYPENAKSFVSNTVGKALRKKIGNVTDVLDRVNVRSMEEVNGVKMVLKLKEGEGNSLNRILKKVDQNAGLESIKWIRALAL